ncbi:(S)-citramalyl-CoA lyase [Paraburkholderia silvatlantica]|uniref:(S)-citramalyl-CoA lyase n=1 Tax=Paraburkholderia silvatlantica TaxID=321895 RepID=A0A2V4TC13_9BURK|nr:aldolase/citrate lyase family protein [Paraburkholderia silvatlantica]PYE23119.1 (S)-citramalyl-CoA lyase [Paraburkholderia silvatlantica]
MPTSLRSWLFTPATRPERFAKAASVAADILIMDLEDSVALADKDRARSIALRTLNTTSEGPARVIRVNALGTRTGLADLTAILQSEAIPDLLLLPKVESPVQLQIIDRLLTEAGAPTALVALIESARGVDASHESLSATPRLRAAMLGAADLAADYGCDGRAPNLLIARARLISAAARACVDAIDSPWFDLHDDAGFQRDVEQAVEMGFVGKAAIHPRQVATINSAFTPTAEQVEHARSVLAVNAAGVGLLDGAMIDEAVARKARRVLAAAGLSTSPEGARHG